MVSAKTVAAVLTAIVVTAAVTALLAASIAPVRTTTVTVALWPGHTTEPWGPYSRTTVTAQNETWIVAHWTTTVVWTIWKPSTVVTITHFNTLTTTVYLQRTTGPPQTVTVTTTVTQR
ncbi:MAG: hypothetical protein OEW84_05115 [Aigarchaeota archaeon]|nr:hypothetical protein [Aigarchaeota archaeon]